MTPRLRWLILGSALAGLGAATASAWVHYRLLTDPTYISPCDMGASFNCTQVYLSQYGSVRGVSVALGGILWFGLVALVVGFSKPVTDGRKSVAGAYLFGLGTVGLGVSLYLAYVSLAVLKTGCVLCMATYACVVAIVILASRVPSVPVASLPGRILGDLGAVFARPSALAAAVLYGAGAVALVAYFPREGALAAQAAVAPAKPTAQVAAEQQGFAQAWAQQPRLDLGVPAEGARVVIVKFNDFECGGCAQAHAMYQPVLDRFAKTHPGAVKLVVKDWPWNTSCNFGAQRTIPGHEASCAAAAAARLARDRGKYPEMETWLYGNQLASVSKVKDAAAKILGVPDFDREYALKLPDIRRDIADGVALKIDSTPTYFINGVRIGGAGLMPAALFELAINLELQP